MSEDTRKRFETACFAYYQRLKAAGWSHPDEGDATPESLFWRKPNGMYGVEQIEAAWQGFLFAQEPVDMLLFCPNCGEQHIDAPSDDAYDGNPPTWTNPPHRSHLCHNCGHIWRPADVPTNGVAEIKTAGKNDSPPVKPSTTRQQHSAQSDAYACGRRDAQREIDQLRAQHEALLKTLTDAAALAKGPNVIVQAPEINRNVLFVAMRELGYTTRSQTDEYIDLFMQHLAAAITKGPR